MFGENMRSEQYLKEYIKLVERVLKKNLEDLIEAYLRTPPQVSSKIYIYRSLRRTQNLLSCTHSLYEKMQQHFKGE